MEESAQIDANGEIEEVKLQSIYYYLYSLQYNACRSIQNFWFYFKLYTLDYIFLGQKIL
jgi:hypothetical protein